MSKYDFNYDDFFERDKCSDYWPDKYPCSQYCHCCTGPTGPVGTILGSYDTLCDLIVDHPIGKQGDAYLVGGDLYVWNEESQRWNVVGNLQGPTGPVGTILDSYETLEELKSAHPTGNQGDAYIVGGQLYVWNEDTKSWQSMGDLSGPTGPTGPAGAAGPTAQYIFAQ